MTKEEMRSVWTMLGTYRPGDNRLRDKGLMEAWWRTIGPYEMQAVKNAIAAHFRSEKKKYFPDIAEITARLPALPGEIPDATKPQPSMGAADQRANQQQEALFARMRAERERLNPLRHAAGIPATWPEAQAARMGATEWWKVLEVAGLNYPDEVFAAGKDSDDHAGK